MLEYTESDFDKVVSLNLKGSFFAMQEAGKKMARQKSGSIVLFSSIRSQVVEPGQSVYAATKAGAVQVVKTLAAELGVMGVRVNAIAPGVVETPLTEPIKARPEWYEAYAQKGGARALGAAFRDGRGGGLPGERGCVFCHGHTAPGRWGLDGGGWAVHAAALNFRARRSAKI